jgi:transcription initiation factor IIE alpha subunit
VLLGDVAATCLPVWRALVARGRADAAELCGSLELDVETCGRLLDELYRNRLVRRCGDEYESLEACYAAVDSGPADDPPPARPE